MENILNIFLLILSVFSNSEFFITCISFFIIIGLFSYISRMLHL